MFKIISMREDGSSCLLVNEIPAFYALMHNNMCVGVYFTLQACKQATEDLITYGAAKDNLISIDFSSEQEPDEDHIWNEETTIMYEDR